MKHTRGHEPGKPSDQRSKTFSSAVWADPVLTADGNAVAAVFFPPGVRTNWHVHEHGQFLFVTSGHGYAQTRGGSGSLLSPGDVVWFPPGEEHWHGALSDTCLAHTAVSLGTTDWRDPVSEEDYRASVDDAR